MRGDDELLSEYAEYKARQNVRIAAAQRRDTADPRTAELREPMGGISGLRLCITAFALSLIVNVVFAMASLGHLGGLRGALFGGLFWLPAIIPVTTMAIVDWRGFAGWKVHALIGLVAVTMLIGVPIIFSIFISQIVPASVLDSETMIEAYRYFEYFIELLPVYVIGFGILAVITGAALRWLSLRKHSRVISSGPR